MSAVSQRLTDQDESFLARVNGVGIDISLLLMSKFKGNSLASRVFRAGAIVPDLLSATPRFPAAGSSSQRESQPLLRQLVSFGFTCNTKALI